jgi:tRNA(Ile)-lysidine synthase
MSRRASSADVMATRTAVASSLVDLAPGARVVVACSGGPDSLALAGAAAWVGDRQGLEMSAVVVDHGLQPGSAEVAHRAVAACAALGLAAEAVRVEVGREGGPEAAARAARYAALERAARDADAATVLLGHTRDDQAETVLLRLARGSGARSLAGMSARSGLWRRPFLDLARATVHEAALQTLSPLGLAPWADPHNDDPDFARVRVRTLLAGLGADLGPGVVLGLSRSAGLLRDDADALDAIAAAEHARAVAAEDEGDGKGRAESAECDVLAAMPSAVRTRVIRLMCLACGSPGDALGLDHVRRVDALVTEWRGQGEVALPGGVTAARAYGRLCLRSSRPLRE